ncbi:MAG: 16S rRNA (cytosine(1402)-N(4))-methyltransferase RsmH [Gammaproteobacteria bacterium]|nr:16S rRNA (cytosine(1402)-N(4))-methyltransferase RsmH [Gammaproteobacteria bacterium]
MPAHVPVLLDEVLSHMITDRGGAYVDATFGRGGHARALLAGLAADARLRVIDRDPEAIACARELAAHDPRVEVVAGPFSALGTQCADLRGRLAGVLLDIGVSSPQLDDAARGFSFRHEGPLDMRMDPASGQSAAEWLASAREEDIADVLWRYGEERRSRHIARRIVATRDSAPLRTTSDLATLVRACVHQRGARIDPATRTFQAVRMHVNDELGELDAALDAALELLAPGGRLLVIAFHSLEDRMVKQRFRALDDQRRVAAREGASSGPLFRLVVRKAIKAGASESAANPRARSARLRVLERVQ